MGDFGRCPVCKEYEFLSRHKCAPKWECRMEQQDEAFGWNTVHAHDSETAAEKYAERYDCDGGDYMIVSRKSEAIVLVRKPDDHEAIERFAIEAEAIPQYRATLIK